MRQTKFVEAVIYRAKRGQRYCHASKPRFNCYVPASSGYFAICDCWVTDEHGNVDPGLNVSPVPVCWQVLGPVIGCLGLEE